MSFDWNDYSTDSGTEDVPLLLSTRSQSLILAAMESLESRSSWLDVDDSTWDDIHAAVGEAYEEIMEVIDMSGTLGGAMMHSNANQNMGSPSGAWYKVDFQVEDYDTEGYISDVQSFAVPANGLYQVGFAGIWQSNSSSDGFLRSVRFTLFDGVTNKPISLDNGLIVSQQITHNMTIIRQFEAGDIVRVEGLTGVPNLNLQYLAGQGSYFWIEHLR